MVMAYDPLDDCLALVDGVAEEAANDPLKYQRWMVPQLKFLMLPSKSKAYRAGNQALGKSTVGLATVLMHVRGQHPYQKVKKPPVNWVVCSLNQTQSLAIQEKFQAFVGANELHKDCSWNPKTGYGANKPFTQFKNGSTIRWVTDDQGPRAVAGSTLDGVLVDEPCSPEMLRELQKRLLRRAGTLLMTFTPINGPTQHIRDAIEAGFIDEIHAPLTPENLRWADTGEVVTLEDGTPCDAAWIADIKAKTHPTWSPIVDEGLWEMLPQSVFYDVFDRNKHVSTTLLVERSREFPVAWTLGIDYATADREFGHVAVLSQVQQFINTEGRRDEVINVVDVVALPGTADNLEFGQKVLKMLDDHGLRWRSLYAVIGDNPVRGRFELKGNLETTKTIARLENINRNALVPVILNAKEGTGKTTRSMWSQYLYSAIRQNRFRVHPRAHLVIDALETFDYTDTHPRKDIIDALRYGLKPWFIPRATLGNVRVMVR